MDLLLSKICNFNILWDDKELKIHLKKINESYKIGLICWFANHRDIKNQQNLFIISELLYQNLYESVIQKKIILPISQMRMIARDILIGLKFFKGIINYP